MRIKPTTTFTPRVKPTEAEYSRPRYVAWDALCDIYTDLLHDITWDQLITSDQNSEPQRLINTIYT